MKVSELILGTLVEKDGTWILKKPDDFGKQFEQKSFLDFESDGRVIVSKKEKMTLAQKLAQATAKKQEGSSDTNLESNVEAKVDFYSIDEKSYEVSVLKATNQMANDQSYEDQEYAVIKMEISVQKVDNSILELRNPNMMKEPRLLSDKVRPSYDSSTGIVTKKVSPFRFQLSVTLPMADGEIKFKDKEALNSMITFIEQSRAKTMEGVYKSGVLNSSNEAIFRHALAMENKGRIRNYLTNILIEQVGENEILDMEAINRRVSELIDEIWEELGVHSLTDWKINISLQIDIIHRSSDPDAFYSKRATIYKDNTGSFKIERSNKSIDMSYPYLIDQENELNKDMTKLITAFTVWAENEARLNLGLETVTKNITMPTIYAKNKTVASVVGLEESKATDIATAVTEIITKKMSDKGTEVKMDALAEKV